MRDKNMNLDPVFVGSMTTLFIGDLAYACSETDLAVLCGRYGVVVSVEIKRGQMGDSLSHGFVEYGSHAMASAAMVRLQNLKFMGRKLRCYWGNSSVAATESDQSQWIQVHVSFTSRQLQMVINEELLDLLFSQFGEVADVCIKRHNYHDREDFKQRGYGFVYFLHRQAAMLALSILGKASLDGINFECSLSKRSVDVSMEAADAAILQGRKPVIRGPRELISQQPSAAGFGSQQQTPNFRPPYHYAQQQQHFSPPFMIPPSPTPMMFAPPMLLPIAPLLIAAPQHLEQISPPMMYSNPMVVPTFPYCSGIPSPATGSYFSPAQPMGIWLQAPSPPMQPLDSSSPRLQYHHHHQPQQSSPRYNNFSLQQQQYLQNVPHYNNMFVQRSPPILYSAHHSPQHQQQLQQHRVSPGFVHSTSTQHQQQQQFVAGPPFPYPVQIQQLQLQQPLPQPLHYSQPVNLHQFPQPQQQQQVQYQQLLSQKPYYATDQSN